MKCLFFICTVLFMSVAMPFGGLLRTPEAHAQNIIITGVDDYNLGTHTVGTGDKLQVQAFCVGKDSGNKFWDSVITGSGAGGAYTLDDGSGNTIPFTVIHPPSTQFISGVPELNWNTADNTMPIDCDGVDDQDIRITVTGADLDATPAGTYTGTITIVVNP